MKKTSRSSDRDPDDVLARIAPIGSVEEYLTFMFYGRSGTGKTTLSATFPKPLLMIDIKEKGTQSIRSVQGIELASIEHFDEFEAVYHFLTRKGKKYKTIVCDPVSGLQRLAIAKVREDRNKGPMDIISKQDWGQISGMMTTWLGNYRDLVSRNHHIVFTAHERTNAGDDSPEDQIDPTIGPQLSPSVSAFLCGAVDVIGHTAIRERIIKKDGKKIRKPQYVVRVGPHAYYTTKIRKPRDFSLPPEVINCSFDKLVKLSRGESIEKEKVDVKA